jgi:hypothetical protein
MSEQKQENVIFIKDQKHDVDLMKPEQQFWVAQMKVLSVELNNLRAAMDKLQRSFNTYQDDLFKSLEEKETEEAEVVN